MEYLDVVNHKNFKEANLLVHKAKEILIEMGLTKEQAYDWIKAWSSGAGDGSY